MKFCWCSIMVMDMDESVKFYKEIVGLSIRRKISAWPKVEIVFMGDGGDEIELVYDPKNKIPGRIDGVAVGFEVKSVEDMIRFVRERGLELESGPFEPNPFVKFFNIRDPNGIRVEFIQKNYPPLP